jgi:periplasmic divalent cation tolerance protein
MIHLVFTTVPNVAIGRKITRDLLKKRLAACVHLAPAGESHYWWKGKMERARETVLMIKTSKKALPTLLRTLKILHPYETPEILAIRVDQAYGPYRDWILNETHF